MDKIKGFISGCFDGFHKGHQHILSEIKKDCTKLVVAINSDDYIRNFKKREPLQDINQRVQNLINFGVDKIEVIYDNPLQTILKEKPNVIYVGDDYVTEEIVGYPECLEWEGEIRIIKRIGGYSTTKMI